LDHFYAHHLGLGAPVIKRERITATAPESLDNDEQRRFLRAWHRCGCTRNAAIGNLLLYTGLRVEEVEAVGLDDVVISARRGR
jgi:integrase